MQLLNHAVRTSGSPVLSDSDLLEYVDVVAGVVGDGFAVEVDTGYRNLTVDQCQAVCANVSVCAAVTWLHCCPSHCVLMSSCSGTSGWDDSLVGSFGSELREQGCVGVCALFVLASLLVW